MNRRIWIKELVVVAGGLVLLPSCLHRQSKASIPLKNIAINSDEEMLLSAIIDTIIPVTDTKGAKDLELQRFVLKMVDDCYVKADQEKFIKGLKNFNTYLNTKTGKAFNETIVEKRPALFADLTAATAPEKDVHYFLATTKQLTVTGYTQSKYVMTELLPYELVPGRFYGCASINKSV